MSDAGHGANRRRLRSLARLGHFAVVSISQLLMCAEINVETNESHRPIAERKI